ncbi:uncharacterized protein FOMMEDRAFT_170262 [Fomitiporia mediterranea MF3/22]|uniref:uncharacterized protein n=1 Tax=Fomitiporia mediterranea (strain MF3/22) TaxID=694068 RepID=UPI00044094F0|nr:uncharacterized protein FOMMEDRAFT_170262 [Fomitiporia mediterranea MF3/22]EJC99608.1 hypothetical protein FOMMEDRAFT_170262 [Fomitiporia mediterranea MF3/22]
MQIDVPYLVLSIARIQGGDRQRDFARSHKITPSENAQFLVWCLNPSYFKRRGLICPI